MRSWRLSESKSKETLGRPGSFGVADLLQSGAENRRQSSLQLGADQSDRVQIPNMNPVDIPVIAQFHLNQIGYRNDGNFNAVYRKVFRSERRICNCLIRSGLFAAED